MKTAKQTRKQKRKISNRIISERALRRNIQKSIRTDLIKESWDSLEELRGDSENAVAALEEGAREAEQEVKSGGFSSMLEGFFNSLGFVDPCDLVRKDPKEVKTQADELENALNELRTARAHNINARLGNFANVVGAAGAGSLTYFAFTNKMNLSKATGDNFIELLRNTDNDERNMSLMQQAQNALPADQVKDGESYAQAAALDAINKMDPTLAFDTAVESMEPKNANVSDSDVRAAAGGDEVGGAAASLVNRWASSGYDKSGPFPDGKRYQALQVFKREDGTYTHDEDEARATAPTGRPDWKREPARKDLITSPGMARDYKGTYWDSARAVVLGGESDVEYALKGHPDYRDMKTILRGDAAGREAVKNAMLKKSEDFKSLGFNDPRDYWDHMMNMFKRTSSITSGAERKWWDTAYQHWTGSRPTDWQRYYDPKGSAWEQRIKNLAYLNTNDLASKYLTGDAPPANANVCGPGMKPGRGGKCIPAIEWNNKGFFTAGKYLVIGSAVLHVYKTLLELAPGPICSIKNFIKTVLGGIFGFIKSIVGPIISAITQAVKSVIDGITSIFESTDKIPVSKFDNSLVFQAKINEQLQELNKISEAIDVINIKNSAANSRRLREISKRVNQKIALKRSLREHAQKQKWLKKYETNKRARALSLKTHFINEQNAMDMAQQVASPEAIKAAQKELDPFLDAWEIFQAMKGVGTNEGEVERVIRKRLNDLDKLYIEFAEMMKMMRVKKKSFQDNLNSKEANIAGGLATAAYGIYAMTPDDTKKKIAQGFKDMGSKVVDAFKGGSGAVVDAAQAAVNSSASQEPTELEKQVGMSLPRDAAQSLMQSVEKAASEPNSKFNKGALKAAGASEKAAEKAAEDPDVNVAEELATSSEGKSAQGIIKGQSGKEYLVIVPNQDIEYKGQNIKAGEVVVADRESNAFKKFSDIAKAESWFENSLKDPIDFDQLIALQGDASSNMSEGVINEQSPFAALGDSIQNLARYSDNPTVRNVGKHIAYAGATAVVAKTATAAAMTWWDGVGLEDDLVQWLEDDGMKDEAELVRKAIEKAGINTRSNRKYDRGY
jgi:hypothetical protein